MERTALYRKYRSADFDQVIGQEHVVRSLEGALKRGLLSHAYLLTGPRGVGKTTVARILARRINDLPKTEDISAHLDIIEIDGASNRGIDEIRALRERITSAPTALKYKVYIIDEVHMLTREAFNALLKTLEEPPPHVVFILATTEVHKLPDTVLSRTQRFDFHPIGATDINKHLRYIADQEKINITDKAISVITQAAQGGFRDAISLLDQLSVLDGEINESIVYDMLGLSPEDAVDELINSVINQDVKKSSEVLARILSLGADPQTLTTQIIARLRDKLLGLVDGGSNQRADAAKILELIDIFNQAQRDFKQTNQYSLPLELAIYKSAFREKNNHSSNNQTNSLINNSTPTKRIIETDESTESLYTKALSYIKTKNNSLYAVMNMASHEIKDNQLILKFNFSFHKDRVEEHKNRQLIEVVMSKAIGKKIELVCVINNQNQANVDPDEELVSTAIEILGGEVVDG